MAGAREIVKDVQREITCGICKGFCFQPVTMECGHSFCRKCLPSRWRAKATAFSCPECRLVSQDGEWAGASEHLARGTELARQLSSQVLQSTEGHNHCAIHKEVFQLFCEDDQTLLCVRCSQSPDHGAHKISAIQEAAHHYREKLQHIQRQLEKSFKETSQVLIKEKTPAVDWYSMISAEYCRLNEFIMMQKSQCLERMKEEEGTLQDRLSQHMNTLKYFRQELQEASHQPSLDVLHDVKRLLGRSQSILSKKVMPVIPELRECPMPGMIDILNKFRVGLSMDPKSASPCFTLSEDLKSVKLGEGWQEYPKDPEDSAAQFVFAEQVFSSDRQYWEVDVTQLSAWTLGICTPLLRRCRSRNQKSGSMKFLLHCVKKKEDYYLRIHPGSFKNQVKGPLPRVGVYLEHAAGTLIFYNVLQCSLIYRFYPIPFEEPVTPVFSPGPPLPGTEDGAMTLCAVDSHLCACCYTRM